MGGCPRAEGETVIVAMGDNATLVLAVTAKDIEHLQSGQKDTIYGETLAYEGKQPLGVVQNVVILYAADKESLIRIFKEAGVDANPNTIPDWADKARRGERTDSPKK